jgi:hypothetical protein
MDLIFPAGKLLFHGTSEEFPAKELRGGGYDRIIWTAESPDIAQNYIPISGASTIVYARDLSVPQKCEILQQLQRRLGIEYDYSKIEWDYMDRPSSFYYPEGYDRIPEEDEVNQLLEEAGWEKYEHGWSAYKIRMTYQDSYNRLMGPNEKLLGRLFILKALKPIKIYDYTFGGERESDLMDLDYHKINIFRAAEEKGYDGIKINDFAQSEIWGNLGHTSIGLFDSSLSEFRWVTIPATNYDWKEYDDFKRATTPEYESLLLTLEQL